MAKEHLVKARELIAKGWTKGSLVNNGCYCLDGAVGAANLDMLSGFSYPDIRANKNAVKDLQYLVQFTLPVVQKWGYLESYSVEKAIEREVYLQVNYTFNDRISTTQEDVLAILDKAIENYPENVVDTAS